jgi:hypothetical protein
MFVSSTNMKPPTLSLQCDEITRRVSPLARPFDSRRAFPVARLVARQGWDAAPLSKSHGSEAQA